MTSCCGAEFVRKESSAFISYMVLSKKARDLIRTIAGRARAWVMPQIPLQTSVMIRF